MLSFPQSSIDTREKVRCIASLQACIPQADLLPVRPLWVERLLRELQ